MKGNAEQCSILHLVTFAMVQKLNGFPEKKTELDVEWCTYIVVVVFQQWNKYMFSKQLSDKNIYD
jgi:hypothetical protein